MPGTLSFRDVEDLLAERGIVVSYETVRRWVKHVGSMIAADLRRRRPKPHSTWHLDEGFTKIDGRLVYLWRAVDAEGEVLDVLVQSKLDKRAAQKDLIIGCRYRIGGVLGTAGTPFSAIVPWRFSDAGRKSAWIGSSTRRPKTCAEADIQRNWNEI